MAPNRSWQEVAFSAQSLRDESISRVLQIEPISDNQLNVTKIAASVLATEELRITETNTESLVSSLALGDIGSVQVTSAFLRRAALAQKLVNCVTELLPDRALQRARELDEFFAKNGRPVGPLHGLPISVKEHISVKGLRVNGGFCSTYENIAEDDAHILKILQKGGCVLFARTTEPQTLMHLETSSNLYNETVNPFNRTLTAGGSSGGEGALIGLRGSALGIGSDIGGSVRSPAANNGLYGFRPSTYRLPTGGLFLEMAGNEQIVCVVGPLSTSIGGIKLFMKSLIDEQPWLHEPSLVPLPWRDTERHIPQKVKVGVLWDDGVVKPHPPITRVLQETVAKLSASAAIEVVEWKPYKHDYAWQLIASLYFCDGGDGEKSCVDASGEPWRPLSRFILHDNPFCQRRSVEDIWNLTKQRDEYRSEYTELWNQTATSVDGLGKPSGTVDVILCPVGPGAAPPLNCARYWGYTSQWNLLDYPALVFPGGHVDQILDGKEESYLPRNEQDAYNHGLYSPERYADAPISLQLVGRRYEDEKVIQAYEHMQRYLK